jgi:DNA-binding GntR family transcriptional regulator
MPKALPVKPVRTDSLSKQVFESLKDAIFSGRFQPGEQLRELHLAEMFGVSQATIREALVQLEQAGLVVRQQNRKTTVTSFTKDEVRDRLAVRLVLEELAFVSAGAKMQEAELKRLAGIARAIQKAIDRGSHRDLTLSDIAFHHFVWEQARNPILQRTLDQLTTPLFAFLGVLQENGLVDVRTTKSHEALVEALRSGNEAAIRKGIRDHIEGSYGSFLQSGAPSLDALVNNSQNGEPG